MLSTCQPLGDIQAGIEHGIIGCRFQRLDIDRPFRIQTGIAITPICALSFVPSVLTNAYPRPIAPPA